MNTEAQILLITAASIGFLHTLTGPDHYLPFIVMSKARNWSTTKTIWITFLCGIGHVGSSIVLGFLGVAFGIGLNKLVRIEAFRGDLAAWAFILFGFLYFLWGLWKAYKNKPHQHIHFHNDGEVHLHHHQHKSSASHNHQHVQVEAKPVNITPWVLFTIFVLGPCEPLIPLLMYPAAKTHIGLVVIVAAVFSVCTIVTMLSIVLAALYGIHFLPVKTMERYMHALAGVAICLSGCAIVFLGL
jgi:nickel/cobalt transporter (NicO) family protein